MPVGWGRLAVGHGSGASSASHCVTRGEFLSGPQSSDLEKRGLDKMTLRHIQAQHPAPWETQVSCSSLCVHDNWGSRDPAPLLSSLLTPISLFKYNLVFTWFMDSVPVTELHSAWAAYWFSITAAQKNKEMTAALGCRPRAGWERQELIISGVITQAVPGRTVTPGAQPATQWLSASDTMSSPDCSAWVLIPASLDTNPFPIQLPHL